MDIAQILDELTNYEKLPVAAIRAAEANRAAAVPAFMQVIEEFVAANPVERPARSPLFFIFHLLGSWREKAAYRPLARLLALPRDEVDSAISGAIPETVHRVMAAVFDGDPQPLYDVILNQEVDEFVRSRMLETVAMLTLREEITREEASRFLHDCFGKLQSDSGSFVWNGWQSAIAMLRLEEMTPLVKHAFDEEWIDPTITSLKYFQQDLRFALEQSGAGRGPEEEYTLFGDTIEELQTWYDFSPERENTRKRRTITSDIVHWNTDRGQAINPFRDVGRNDPCPCGSGKKFKKCCLNQEAPAIFDERAA